MEKTNNLKLNVWEKTDPIHAKDFNDNFQTIDQQMAYVAICSMVTSESSKEISLDVSKIDFTEYLKLDLIFDHPGMVNGSTSDTALHSLKLNHSTGNAYITQSPTSWNSNYINQPDSSVMIRWRSVSKQPAGIVIHFGAIAPGGNVLCSLQSLSCNGKYYTIESQIGCAPNITWEQLQSIQLISEIEIPAGSHVFLCGIRKPTTDFPKP